MKVVILLVFLAMTVWSVMAVGRKLYKDGSDSDIVSKKTLSEMAIACLVIGTGYWFGASISRLAPVILAIMLGVMVYMAKIWRDKGAEWDELIPFGVIAVPVIYVLVTAGGATVEYLKLNDFWASVVQILPWVALVTLAGYLVSSTFFFRGEKVDKSNTSRGWLSAIVTITAIVFLVWGLKWPVATKAGGDEAPATPAATITTTPAKQEWYSFQNAVLQKDEDEENNFNFGPDPMSLHPEWIEAGNFDADLRDRMKKDPALGAATMAWLDAIVGTRYLGEFYESCKGDWAKTINQSKAAFVKDEEAYKKTLESFFKYLDTASVQIKDADVTTDQMYMNPYTSDGIPDVIVMKTDDHKGKFLVYSFKIKGKTFDVSYRLECGYQPTDVERIMKIKPQPKPVPTPDKKKDPTPTPEKKKDPTPTPPTPTPPDPTPTPPTPTPPDPTPTPPTPTPPDEPKKDHSKGTKDNEANANDNKKVDEDTNNGAGGATSTKEEKGASNSGSLDDYKKKIEQNKNNNSNSNSNSNNNNNSSSNNSNSNTANNTTTNNNTVTVNNNREKLNTSTGAKPASIIEEPVNPWGRGEPE